jgi:hypothetical protein
MELEPLVRLRYDFNRPPPYLALLRVGDEVEIFENQGPDDPPLRRRCKLKSIRYHGHGGGWLLDLDDGEWIE